MGPHVNENEQYSWKIKNSKIQKSKKLYFGEDDWEENSEKVWKDSKVIWEKSNALTFWLP